MEVLIQQALLAATDRQFERTSDDNERVEFDFDYDDKVSFKVYPEEDLQAVMAVALIGVVEPEVQETVYRYLLEANFLFSDTAGATLTADTRTGEVFLQRAWPYPLAQSEGFGDELRLFIQTAIMCSDRVGVLALVDKDDSASPDTNTAGIRI